MMLYERTEERLPPPVVAKTHNGTATNSKSKHDVERG